MDLSLILNFYDQISFEKILNQCFGSFSNTICGVLTIIDAINDVPSGFDNKSLLINITAEMSICLE
jgi:hypothetical protein